MIQFKISYNQVNIRFFYLFFYKYYKAKNKYKKRKFIIFELIFVSFFIAM
jgi:hypothetical protein